MGTKINIIIRHITGLLMAVSLVAGCSWIKSYPNALDKNLQIHTVKESGSFFSSVQTAVDIYGVDANCQTEYQGTVQLKDQLVEVGIPSGKPSYLVFVFSSSSFWANKKGTITYDTLLKPRTGYNYDIRVSYIDDIYNVDIREIQPRKAKGREIKPKGLNECNNL